MARIITVTVATALMLGLAACDPNDPGQRALGGAAIGAGGGAILGGIAGNAGAGALIGGAVGAVGGAATTPGR